MVEWSTKLMGIYPLKSSTITKNMFFYSFFLSFLSSFFQLKNNFQIVEKGVEKLPDYPGQYCLPTSFTTPGIYYCTVLVSFFFILYSLFFYSFILLFFYSFILLFFDSLFLFLYLFSSLSFILSL